MTPVKEPDQTNADSYLTQYAYDPLNNLTRVDQWGGPVGTANERVRTFSYDSLSRLLSSTNPESGNLTYTYDANGNLSKKTTPKPGDLSGTATVTIGYCYDALNRVTYKFWSSPTCASPSAAVAGYSYDQSSYNGLTVVNGIGRRTGMSDASGQSAWSYDTVGRTASIRRTLNGYPLTASYIYDLAGDIKTLTNFSGSGEAYTYDSAGHPTSVMDPVYGFQFASSATYTPPGQLASMTRGPSTRAIQEARCYNSRQQLSLTLVNTGSTALDPLICSSSLSSPPASTVLSLSYCYLNGGCSGTAANTNNGNLTGEVNNLAGSRSSVFSYDHNNRLTSAVAGPVLTPTWSESYAFDPWGNMKSKSTYNVTPTNVTPNNNNQATALFTYDIAGNVANDSPGGSTPVDYYSYDQEGHLVSIHLMSGTLECYLYDGDGQRVEKGLLSGTTCSPDTLYYRGAGGEVNTEAAGNGTVSARNVYFNGEMIARTMASGPVHLFYHDQVGSARLTYNYNNKALEGDVDYYPFGETILGLGTRDSSNSPYLFTGKERDAETGGGMLPYGNDYFGARYYASSMGRFMSPDWADKPEAVPYSKLDNPQSLNLYGYVLNNPLSKADADGHGAEDLAPVLGPIGIGFALGKLGTTAMDAYGNFLIVKADKELIKTDYEVLLTTAQHPSSISPIAVQQVANELQTTSNDANQHAVTLTSLFVSFFSFGAKRAGSDVVGKAIQQTEKNLPNVLPPAQVQPKPPTPPPPLPPPPPPPPHKDQP